MATVLITGANSGIGKAAATALVQQGWRVLATARSPERGEAAVGDIRRAAADASGSGEVELVMLDLASLESVRAAAAQVNAETQIDVLINNAGVNRSQRAVTDDGLEMMMQVNHFGHFLLTSLLLPNILQSGDPRVINVSSMLYRRAGAMPVDDLQLERRWGGFYPYAVSKLANVLFTRGLHRRYFGSGLAAFAAHPGGVRSRLGADGDATGLWGVTWRLLQPLLLSEAKGAAPIVELATEPGRKSQAGAYYNRHRAQQLNAHARDLAASERLWEASCELTGAEWPES